MNSGFLEEKQTLSITGPRPYITPGAFPDIHLAFSIYQASGPLFEIDLGCS